MRNMEKALGPNWFSRHRNALIIWGVVIILLVIGIKYGYGWYQNRQTAATTEATVTMTSPKVGESIQNFNQVNLMCSDQKSVKNVRVVFEDGNGRKIKGSKNATGEEIIWTPNSPVVDPGSYTVLVSGKNIKPDTFTFFISEAKSEGDKEKVQNPPPPADSGTVDTKATLDRAKQAPKEQ